ncbi:peptidase inhibitor family I36 protein [Streptomyces sp. JH14]|uniref:peptidase inhibitor family I36 protein n=1 Tax=Streptomyces sp. JH14 TaxID=2793630 RepID=UPI0023F6F801|nr:peptidase inhibitor family I36 protein [Streptomyces sp. JH14]MDF6042299.1 peptidase inhibitor family I36 protein [Streptomyces sp. JH14]
MRTIVLAAALAATALIPPAASGAAVRTAPAPGAHAVPVRLGTCESGQLCLWEKPDFTGARQIHELSGTDIDSCVPLPPGRKVQALANRTGRPVTTYQSAECAETGEFETYPGGGTWVPQSPYQVRAFKIWEN